MDVPGHNYSLCNMPCGWPVTGKSRYNELPRHWQNVFVLTMVIGFVFIHFTIIEMKTIIRYSGVFVTQGLTRALYRGSTGVDWSPLQPAYRSSQLSLDTVEINVDGVSRHGGKFPVFFFLNSKTLELVWLKERKGWLREFSPTKTEWRDHFWDTPETGTKQVRK